MTFSDAFQGLSSGLAAFQTGAFQTRNTFEIITDRDRAGDVATPEEIRFLRRRDRVLAWQRARQERQRFARITKIAEIIDATLRGPEAANPMDAASGDRPAVEKSDQVKKPVGVPPTEYPHSMLAVAIEKATPRPVSEQPSPEAGERDARHASDIKAKYSQEAYRRAWDAGLATARLKVDLDEDMWQRAAPLRELKTFAADAKRPAQLPDQQKTPAPQLPAKPEVQLRQPDKGILVEDLYKLDAFEAAQAKTAVHTRLKTLLDAEPTVEDLLKSYGKRKARLPLKVLDEEARSSGDVLDQLAAFAAEHDLTKTQARQRLASFR